MKKQKKIASEDDELRELLNNDTPISQRRFALMIGVDHEVVRKLVQRGIISPPYGCRTWMIQYYAYLKGVAAGRRGTGYYRE